MARRATSSAASWPCCWGSKHHDLALLEAPQARPADPQCAGLVHVALRIGDHIETLRAFHAHLRSLGVALQHARDHQPSQSLSLRELDGLLVEVYVDADPALNAARPEAVASVRPLRVHWRAWAAVGQPLPSPGPLLHRDTEGPA